MKPLYTWLFSKKDPEIANDSCSGKRYSLRPQRHKEIPTVPSLHNEILGSEVTHNDTWPLTRSMEDLIVRPYTSIEMDLMHDEGAIKSSMTSR